MADLRRKNSQVSGWDRNRQALILWIGLTSLLVSRAEAGELGLGIGYLGEYTSNVQLTPTNPQEDWINSILAGIAYRENSPELAANVLAQAEFRNYTRDYYQDETLGYLNAAAVWTITPQRFLWTLVDSLNQLPQSSIFAPTPTNLETVNAFATGPDFLFTLDPTNVLVFGARVGNTWLKEGITDQNIFATVLGWRHKIDAISQFSLNLVDSKIVYTETQPVLPTTLLDYLREDLYLRYDRRQTLSRFVMDIGRTRILPDGEIDSVSEPLVHLDLARRLSSDSAVGLSLRREVMDVGSALLAGVADPTVPELITAPPGTSFTALATGDIFITRGSEAYYNLTGHYFGWQASIYQHEFEYRHLFLEDRIESGARLQASYNFSATVTASAYSGTQKTDYQHPAILNRDVNYGLLMTYRLNPSLTLSLDASHTERNSSEQLLGYEVTRGIVRLIYSSTPSFSPAAVR
jgi:hypothetical protein